MWGFILLDTELPPTKPQSNLSRTFNRIPSNSFKSLAYPLAQVYGRRHILDPGNPSINPIHPRPLLKNRQLDERQMDIRTTSYIRTKDFVTIKPLFMKRNASIGLVAALVLAGFFTIAQNRSSSSRSQQKTNIQDTIPQHREGKVKDFDEAMRELDKAMQHLNTELKKPIPPLPPMEIEKIRADVDKALKEIDPEKMKAEIEKAMKDVDAQKIKAEVQASLAKVDMEKTRKELEHFRDVELKKIEEEMKNMRPQIEKSLKDAKESIEKAKVEIQEYKEFETSLEKDGLIDKKQYTIEHKNGVLTINGQKQPEAVYNKYRSFLEKHKDLMLKKNAEGLDIRNEKD